VKTEDKNCSTIHLERIEKMKASLSLNRILTIQVNLTGLIAFFAKLTARMPRFNCCKDDVAALRYIASKYPGEID
jgi:hypothetical protein